MGGGRADSPQPSARRRYAGEAGGVNFAVIAGISRYRGTVLTRSFLIPFLPRGRKRCSSLVENPSAGICNFSSEISEEAYERFNFFLEPFFGPLYAGYVHVFREMFVPLRGSNRGHTSRDLCSFARRPFKCTVLDLAPP